MYIFSTHCFVYSMYILHSSKYVTVRAVDVLSLDRQYSTPSNRKISQCQMHTFKTTKILFSKAYLHPQMFIGVSISYRFVHIQKRGHSCVTMREQVETHRNKSKLEPRFVAKQIASLHMNARECEDCTGNCECPI